MKNTYLAAGLAGLLYFLVSYIPAPLLYHWLSDDWGNQLQIFGVSGTLGHGHVARASIAGLELRAVEWRWRPQALLVGRVSRKLTAQTDSGSLEAIVSNPLVGNRLTISQLRGSLPVQQLGQGLGLPVLPFSGELQVELDRFQLRNGKPWMAQGTGNLNNLSFNFSSPPVMLGNYGLELQTPDKSIDLTISSLEGQLEVNGTGQISREGAYGIDLKLRPRATAPAKLAGMLQAFGKPNAEGWYLLKRSGNL